MFGWTGNVSVFSVRNLVIPLCSETTKPSFQIVFSQFQLWDVYLFDTDLAKRNSSDFTVCPVDSQLPQHHLLHSPFSSHCPTTALWDAHSHMCIGFGNPSMVPQAQLVYHGQHKLKALDEMLWDHYRRHTRGYSETIFSHTLSLESFCWA